MSHDAKGDVVVSVYADRLGRLYRSGLSRTTRFRNPPPGQFRRLHETGWRVNRPVRDHLTHEEHVIRLTQLAPLELQRHAVRTFPFSD